MCSNIKIHLGQCQNHGYIFTAFISNMQIRWKKCSFPGQNHFFLWQILGLAWVLKCDINVFWIYKNEGMWSVYRHCELKNGNGPAILLHSALLKNSRGFHCEPLLQFPCKRLIYIFSTAKLEIGQKYRFLTLL